MGPPGKISQLDTTLHEEHGYGFSA